MIEDLYAHSESKPLRSTSTEIDLNPGEAGVYRGPAFI